jgi:thiazole synthase ThiGH ThiG subunit
VTAGKRQLEGDTMSNPADLVDVAAAEEHLMRLLGRHEGLALDSWNRRKIAELRGRMPPYWPFVAESGVQSAEDAASVASLGYRLALVGTSLMKRADPRHAVAEFVDAGRKALR